MKNNFRVFLADGSDPRDYLSNPFAIDSGDAYCNGHMAAIDINSTASARSTPSESVVKILNEHVAECIKESNAWTPLPHVSMDQFACACCKGTGIDDKCRECDGDGYVYFSSDFHEYEAECKSCEAGANKECKYCEGGFGGVKAPNTHASIKGIGVNPGYIKKIHENLLDPMFCASSDNKKLLIKFDGGFAVLMSVNIRGEKALELCN